MRFQNLHTHSTFDDGKSTLEQMVRSAMDAGLCAMGFSGHSPVPFPDAWSIQPERFSAYLAHTRALQAHWRGVFPLFCGLEWDICSAIPDAPLDYLIGAAHYFPVMQDGRRYSVDQSADMLRECLMVQFGGDVGAQEACYYGEVAKLADTAAVDIVAHFDLITKFDEPHAVYHAAPPCALDAMERLVRAGKLFEINTGAIARGCRLTPYPSQPLLRALHEMGGRILFTGDTHNAADIACHFPEAAALAKNCGFTESWFLTEHGFEPRPL